MRLDIYLVEEGVYPTRARAQAAVKAGLVKIDGAVAAKPSAPVAPGAKVDVAGDVHVYVSRGGVKLDAALRAFEIEPSGKICLDLGASTGGFSDVLLRAGAKKIYAVDVGTGQLHPSLIDDPRVINLERTHAKDLSRALIPEPVEILVCDVSFISLKKALPPALALCAPRARLVALIKPQFEVGRSRIGKGGIVKGGYANSYGVGQDVHDWLGRQPGWKSLGWMDSPIAGGDGNKEFLLGAIKAA
ncbi:MAG TPA: TlyA family RNA methyltransferase [Parvularculaceae bacterium]|nr:TlyA family RNA methyltransferase [Parvularculaceae bacterium]